MKRFKIGIVPVIKRSNPDQDAVPLAKAPCAGGDSFGGLICAQMHSCKSMAMISFAVASSAIKHTIRGDGNITDDAESIRSLMNMRYNIKC